MKDQDFDPVLLARANEMLRQERDIFDQRRKHHDMWFLLQVVMGYASIMLLVAVIALSTYVLINNKMFPAFVISSASAALLVDILGLFVGVWRIVLKSRSTTELSPVTTISPSNTESPTNSGPASSALNRGPQA
jgi:hypothetical protein